MRKRPTPIKLQQLPTIRRPGCPQLWKQEVTLWHKFSPRPPRNNVLGALSRGRPSKISKANKGVRAVLKAKASDLIVNTPNSVPLRAGWKLGPSTLVARDVFGLFRQSNHDQWHSGLHGLSPCLRHRSQNLHSFLRYENQNLLILIEFQLV